MSLQLLYWWDYNCEVTGRQTCYVGLGDFLTFHSNTVRGNIVPVKLSPLVRNMSLFLAMGKAELWFKGLATGVLRGDVSLTWSGVSESGHAASTEHENGQTDQGKRNMLFLLCFPCTLKCRDFRYRAQKCSNSRSHSLSFVQAWKLLSWHRWLLKVQPAWTAYSRVKLWPSACSSPHLPLFPLLPEGIPAGSIYTGQPFLVCFGNFPFCKGMIAGGTYIHYHPLPSSTMIRNCSLSWFMALKAIVLSVNSLILAAWVIDDLTVLILVAFLLSSLEWHCPVVGSLPCKWAKYKRVVISCSHGGERGFVLFWWVV